MINAQARGRRWPVMGAAVLILGLAACSPGPAENGGTAEAPAPVATAAAAVTEIRAALAEQNLGVARDRARAARIAHPADPEIHLLAAQVEARLGNGGDSAAAFLKAMDLGLQNPAARLADPAFAEVRRGAPFAAVRQRLGPPAAAPTAEVGKTTATFPRDEIRAGDVAIIEDETGTRIRAGDLVMDARH